MRVRSIAEAQYILSLRCMDEGYKQEIQRGEFANTSTYRYQLLPNRAQMTIYNPMYLLDMPKTISQQMIAEYHAELWNPDRPKEAAYTYGNRIYHQLVKVMEILKKTPNTNQAIVDVGLPSDLWTKHAPCLRLMHFIVIKEKLNLFVFMRSNDLSEAFLLNNYGFASVMSDVAEYAGLEIGDYHYSCSCAHLYSHSLADMAIQKQAVGAV